MYTLQIELRINCKSCEIQTKISKKIDILMVKDLMWLLQSIQYNEKVVLYVGHKVSILRKWLKTANVHDE